ncbi:MAG: glycosyltransferase family 2 protein [Deltaproteobacteria bacterium]|nr:glycosyltransferase family 2 protein [Deltaproteobacteria bacterium]
MPREGISLVIPAYNEADAIGGIVEKGLSVLESLHAGGFEVVVVDDGSTDATAEQARAHGARVVRHPANAGYGYAIKNGIAAASYEHIAIADGDGTYPMEELPRLWKKYCEGYDMVVGSRKGRFYDGSLLKRLSRFLLKLLVEFVTGQGIADINSGMRIFNKRAVAGYFPRLCNTFSFTTSLTLAYLMTGRFVSHVPISYRRRVGRSKVRLFRDTLRTLQYIVEAIMYYNPLKMFLLLSAAMVLAAGGCFAGAAVSGCLAADILGAGFVVLAVVTFSLGLLSVVVSRPRVPEGTFPLSSSCPVEEPVGKDNRDVPRANAR